MNKFNNILLPVTFILVLVNIYLSLVILQRNPTESKEKMDEPVISRLVANEWADKVTKLYNTDDFQSLYQLFHAQAKVKIPEQKLETQLHKLHQLFGDINKHAFLQLVPVGQKGSAQYIQVFYNVRVSSKQIENAKLTLSFVLEDDVVSLYGVRLNALQDLN